MSKSHAHAPKQESTLAKKLGGIRVKGSGSGDEKGDVRVAERGLRIECKSTIHGSYSLSKETWRKIEMAALSAGEIPVMQIDFLEEGGSRMRPISVAVIPVHILEELKSSWNA